MTEKQQQKRSLLFMLAGLAVLGVLAGLGVAADPSSAGLPAYDVTLTPNYLSPNDARSSDYQAVWIYGTSPTTPYISPDSYAHQGRYLLLDPRQTDAAGHAGRDDWWFVIQRYWPSSYQPSNHGNWGREVNFHNVAGDAGPGGGVGWGFGSGVSSLALDWLPGASAPQFTVEPNHPNESFPLPPVSRNAWHTYVVHFIAGRTDGTTVHPGALTVWADGSNTPVINQTNINTVQRAQGPDGQWYVQRWMQLWEGDYTQNLQAVSTVRLTLTRIGATLQQALADRPTIAGTSVAGQFYSGSGANDGAPSVTQVGSLTANDGAIPASLGGAGQALTPSTATATATATATTTTAAATTTTRTTGTNAAPAKAPTARTTTSLAITTRARTTTIPHAQTMPTTTDLTPAPTPAVGEPSGLISVTTAPAAAVEWDGVRYYGWTGLRSYLAGRGVSADDFLRSHPAIVKILALPALLWDGTLFFIRSTFASWLSARGGDYGLWAARHPQAVGNLTA
jgi:hypothetical protein